MKGAERHITGRMGKDAGAPHFLKRWKLLRNFFIAFQKTSHTPGTLCEMAAKIYGNINKR
jgi:hypothetical protein